MKNILGRAIPILALVLLSHTATNPAAHGLELKSASEQCDLQCRKNHYFALDDEFDGLIHECRKNKECIEDLRQRRDRARDEFWAAVAANLQGNSSEATKIVKGIKITQLILLEHLKEAMRKRMRKFNRHRTAILHKAYKRGGDKAVAAVEQRYDEMRDAYFKLLQRGLDRNAQDYQALTQAASAYTKVLAELQIK